jgi:hypothetical protein
MIELSFAGLIGAFAGTALAAFAYASLFTALQRALGVRPPEEISLLRRALLAMDILVFAGLGYWLGMLLAG